jgi:hypothetical protein
MRDAAADISRRAWTACPRCADHRACGTCGTGSNCDVHWRYLLDAKGRRLFLQCRSCWHRWWHDTGFGAGDRPSGIDSLAEFPPRGGAVA